jgi:hypothetical protein
MLLQLLFCCCFFAAIYYDTYDFDDDEMEIPVVDEDKGPGEKLNALAN